MAAYSAARAAASASRRRSGCRHFSASRWVARAAAIDPSSAARSAGAAAQARGGGPLAGLSPAPRSAASAPAGSAAGALVGPRRRADGTATPDHPGQLGGVRGVRLGDRVEPVGQLRVRGGARPVRGGQPERLVHHRPQRVGWRRRLVVAVEKITAGQRRSGAAERQQRPGAQQLSPGMSRMPGRAVSFCRSPPDKSTPSAPLRGPPASVRRPVRRRAGALRSAQPPARPLRWRAGMAGRPGAVDQGEGAEMTQRGRATRPTGLGTPPDAAGRGAPAAVTSPPGGPGCGP